MTTLTDPAARPARSTPAFSFLWLEVTGRCGLACSHCYAGSGPSASHGVMTGDDWRSLITQAADMGVPAVQFTAARPPCTPTSSPCLPMPSRPGSPPRCTAT